MLSGHHRVLLLQLKLTDCSHGAAWLVCVREPWNRCDVTCFGPGGPLTLIPYELSSDSHMRGFSSVRYHAAIFPPKPAFPPADSGVTRTHWRRRETRVEATFHLRASSDAADCHVIEQLEPRPCVMADIVRPAR